MKMLVFFRRREGLSATEFRAYYEERHAPLAMSFFPYIKDNRRNYIRHDLQHRRFGGEAINNYLDFDVITEIIFETQQDYERMVKDMANPEIRERVVNDEMQFLDRDATLV